MMNAPGNMEDTAGRYVQHRGRITERLGRAAANGHRIMEKLFDHPIVTVARVRQWLHVTPAGANNLVNRLVEIGVLREITGYARNRRFRFDPYLRPFEEPGRQESDDATRVQKQARANKPKR